MTRKKKPKSKLPPERGPLFLVLETATGVSSVALYERDQLLAHADYHANKLHAQLITVLAQRLLEDLGLSPQQLAGVFVSRGPGSYTGLRVGVSAAKGLAMAVDCPLFSIGSLELVAWSVRDLAGALGATIVAMIDARRMEVFCRWFDADGTARNETEARIVEAGTFAEELAQGPVVFCGDGAEKCREILEAEGGIVLGDRLSSASRMGALVWKKYQEQDREDLVTFEPYYLKNFVATISRKKLI